MKHPWLYLSKRDLEIERAQLLDEGRDLGPVQAELEELLHLPDDEPSLQERLGAFLDKTAALPLRPDYPFQEPSDLEGIRQARPAGPRRLDVRLAPSALYDRFYGAWLGRCAGCLLGKPVEGWRTSRMWGYLRDLGAWPLADYFRSDVPAEVARRYDVQPTRPFIDRVDHMVEDDDLNYTVAGLAVLKEHGAAFTPADVAAFWLGHIPILRTCTAERVAYRNLSLLIAPPGSALHRNVYREWIGAQIRADAFGYVAAGHPETAAAWAWRDGSISHVKNGLYGEMWVAAMLAAAVGTPDIEAVIRIGLSEIPARSRLAADIQAVLDWYRAGVSYEEAVGRLHQRWDEHQAHHWCHTNSNAQVVAVGLLWGQGDFGRSICRAVQAGFDTDCNGATVGSIVGLMQGASRLPQRWIAPLHDTLETGLAGYGRVAISPLAHQTFDLYNALAPGA